MNNNDVLNHMHQLHLVLADEVKQICEKNNINYFMIAGTMLGAIRHQGFIPWDDDMDFGMLRNDYERFLHICETELDSTRFYLQTDNNDKYYTFNFAKLRLKGTRVLESFSSTVSTEQGIYIDIFPIDMISDNKFISLIQYKLFWFFRNVLWVKCGYGDENRKKELGYKVAKFLSCFFSINFLKKMKHKVISCCKDKKTEYVIVSDGTYGLKKETLRFDWIENLSEYNFENKQYPGIKDYDAYLSYFYGDYLALPPIERQNHHGRLEIDFGPY